MEKAELITKLREQYIENLPAGYSKREIKSMSDEDLLDMHYFLNEEDDDDFEEPDSPDFFLHDLCLDCQKKLKAIMEKKKSVGR